MPTPIPTSSFAKTVYMLTCLCLVFSCTDNKKKMLSGEWKLVDQTITCNNPIEDSIEAVERRSKNLPVATLAQQSEEGIRKGNSYVFAKDGKYIEKIGEQMSGHGKYTLADSGIILSSEMGFVSRIYTFKTFNDSVLNMTMALEMKGHMHTYDRKFVKMNK